jgi:hypothetical protein
VRWNFAGTKHFVRIDPALAPYKDLLLQMFSALEAGDRAAMLKQLHAIELAALRADDPRDP